MFSTHRKSHIIVNIFITRIYFFFIVVSRASSINVLNNIPGIYIHTLSRPWLRHFAVACIYYSEYNLFSFHTVGVVQNCIMMMVVWKIQASMERTKNTTIFFCTEKYLKRLGIFLSFPLIRCAQHSAVSFSVSSRPRNCKDRRGHFKCFFVCWVKAKFCVFFFVFMRNLVAWKQ